MSKSSKGNGVAATMQVTPPPMTFKALNVKVASMPVNVDLGPINQSLDRVAGMSVEQTAVTTAAVTELVGAVKSLTTVVSELLKALADRPADTGAKVHDIAIKRDSEGRATSMRVKTG